MSFDCDHDECAKLMACKYTIPHEAAPIDLPTGSKAAQPNIEAKVLAVVQNKWALRQLKKYEFESLRIQRVTRRVTKP